MRIFIDSADYRKIEKWLRQGVVDGANRERADLEWTSGIRASSFSHRLDGKNPDGTEWVR